MSFMQQLRTHLQGCRNVTLIDYIKQRTPLSEIVRVNALAKAISGGNVGNNGGKQSSK